MNHEHSDARVQQHGENFSQRDFSCHNDLMKDLYSGLPCLNGDKSSSKSSSCDDSSLDFGSCDALYGNPKDALKHDISDLSRSLDRGDLQESLRILGQTLRDLTALMGNGSGQHDHADGGSSTATSDSSHSSSTDAPQETGHTQDTTSTTPSESTDHGTTPDVSAGTDHNVEHVGDGAGSTAVNGAAPIALGDLIDQQDQSKNTVFPGGGVLNDGIGWRIGASGMWPNDHMAPDVNESVSWMTSYPIDGSAQTPGSSITVNHMNEWALLKDGTWKQISTTDDGVTWAQSNPNNFSQNLPGIIDGDLPRTTNSDGSFTIGAAPDGLTNQFGAAGGRFTNSDIVGLYVSAQVKADSNDSNTALQIGADYYKDGQYREGVGTSNWVKLTDQYQTIAFTDLDPSILRNNPPPGVTA